MKSLKLWFKKRQIAFYWWRATNTITNKDLF